MTTKNFLNVSAKQIPKITLALATLLFIAGPAVTNAAMLTRQLEQGMSGNDVGTLQTFLAQDNTIYPQGLVTNYFGTLTTSAVSNFQSKNGIATAGRVGPVTLNAINAQMAGGGTTSGGYSTNGDIYAPIISGVSVNRSTNSVVVSWNTNESARGVVYYSTSPLSEYELPHSVTIGGNSSMSDTSLHTSHAVTLSGLQANTMYFYIVYTTDAQGNVTITMPSTFQTNS